MSDITIVRTLMNLRDASRQRNEVVDAAAKAGDWPHSQWAAASRIWSRQNDALLRTIVAEPPVNLNDVMSVLCCLAEARDQHENGDDPTPIDERNMREMTNVAIHNCIRALAVVVTPPAANPTATEIQDRDWSAALVSRWLPQLDGDKEVAHAQ